MGTKVSKYEFALADSFINYAVFRKYRSLFQASVGNCSYFFCLNVLNLFRNKLEFIIQFSVVDQGSVCPDKCPDKYFRVLLFRPDLILIISFHFNCIVGFKYELALCLNGTVAIPDLHREENAIFTEFRSRGQAKTFFNYLLLDPTIFKSLDTTLLNDHTNDDVMFRSFIEAIFYIGKGKHSRSLQHLKDAKKGSQITPSGHIRVCCVSLLDMLILLFFSSFLV